LGRLFVGFAFLHRFTMSFAGLHGFAVAWWVRLVWVVPGERGGDGVDILVVRRATVITGEDWPVGPAVPVVLWRYIPTASAVPTII
jgi:hypothetical protein